MKTQTQNSHLEKLRRAAADLRGEIIDTKIELQDCPNRRDADGCALDDDYNNLSDQLESLETELEQIEAEIEEIESERVSEQRGQLLALRLDLQLTLRGPQYRTATFARRQIEAQLREIEAQIDALSG